MPNPKLLIIIASTRPGRIGPTIAQWFHEVAVKHGQLDCEVADLAEMALPLLDEPNHPRLRKYEQEHTRKWSKIVDSADAFAVVTPEYNYNPPAPLINALDYLFEEWAYKPLGFVSYGGVSGGLRSVQVAKSIVTSLKMMPLVEAVVIPFVSGLIQEGRFQATELHIKSAETMLTELRRWSEALRVLRG